MRPSCECECHRGEWLLTFTGRRVFLWDPRPEDIDPLDVAHGLALTNRFGGQSLVPYSVAQHSEFVSRYSGQGSALVGLLHDATEAYLGDVVRPFKDMLSEYEAHEARWALAIGQRFGLGDGLVKLPADVKRADAMALATEWRDLVAGGSETARNALTALPVDEHISPLPWSEAKQLFLTRLATFGFRT